jgi:hypothetical protein
MPMGRRQVVDAQARCRKRMEYCQLSHTSLESGPLGTPRHASFAVP